MDKCHTYFMNFDPAHRVISVGDIFEQRRPSGPVDWFYKERLRIRRVIVWRVLEGQMGLEAAGE